jgi:hypothetical protein
MLRYRLIDQQGHTVLTTISSARAEQDCARRAAPTTIASDDVEVIGRFGLGLTDGGVLWADGRTSPAWEFDPTLPEPTRAPLPLPLPGAGSTLLSAIYGSDIPGCAAVGGPLVVATVVECVTTVVARDPRATRGGFQSPVVDQLDVVLADGSRRTWYAATVGYSEGYLYALAPTYKAAVDELTPYDAQIEVVS